MKIVCGDFMSKKILVADDSATIQKVVSITLANESCELVEALDSQSMLDKLANDKYALVLLDFNLSEDVSGYDLAETIKETSPGTNIIAMLGTFDSVEEDRLEEVGINDVVVKPFESNKFIQSCRTLMANFDEGGDSSVSIDDVSNLPVEEFPSQSEEESEDLAEGWVAKTPEIADQTVEEEDLVSNVPNFTSPSNALHSELEGWGMEVPSVIGNPNADGDGLFPPKIEGADEEVDEDETAIIEMPVSGDAFSSEDIFPMTSDREISADPEPDVDESIGEKTSPTKPFIDLNGELENGQEEASVELEMGADIVAPSMEFEISSELDSEPSENEVKPNFQSIDDFNLKEESEDTADADKTVEIQMEQFDLEKEIEQEENPETFWAADEEDDPYSVEEGAGDIIKFGPHGTQAGYVASGGLSESDKEEIINILSEKVRGMVEDVVKELCETKVDSVAWEVIPDLAENLIKKEIKELSDSVQ